MDTMNPLLDFSGLPRFDAVQPEHVAPAIRQLLDENRALIETLIAPETAATWCSAPPSSIANSKR